METGQRYPVLNEDVVIGRTSGDILFGQDMKMSNQHCRLVMMPEGLGIHDLNSANGTIVDGVNLANEKVYALRPGSVIQTGAQTFKLTEATFKKRATSKTRGRRRRRSRQSWSTPLLAVIAVAVAVLGPSLWREFKRREVAPPPPANVESPFEMVQREFRRAIDGYKKLGADAQAGRISDQQMAAAIRREVLPNFKLVQSQLWAVRPDGEAQKRQLDLNRRITDAVIGQITAMAENAELHSEKSALLLKKYSGDLEKLSSEEQALKKRMPAAAPGPDSRPPN